MAKKTRIRADSFPREYDLEHLSLSDKVYFYIKNLILSGELKAGERVPEIRVGERFGVSRTPIREALKRLEEYGLIYIEPRSYAEVVSLSPDEAPDVAAVRVALERLSISLLSERGTEEDFDRLDEIANECSAALERGNIAEAFEKDSELHIEFAQRSGNVHLFRLFEKFDAKVQLLRLVLHLPYDQLHAFVNQHQGIIDAVRKRDTDEAKRRIEDHILLQLKHSNLIPRRKLYLHRR